MTGTTKTVLIVAAVAGGGYLVYRATRPAPTEKSLFSKMVDAMKGIGLFGPSQNSQATPQSPLSADSSLDLNASAKRGVPYGTAATQDGNAAISDGMGYVAQRTYIKAPPDNTLAAKRFTGEVR